MFCYKYFFFIIYYIGKKGKMGKRILGRGYIRNKKVFLLYKRERNVIGINKNFF